MNKSKPREDDYIVFHSNNAEVTQDFKESGWYVSQCLWTVGPFDSKHKAVDRAFDHAKKNQFFPGFWEKTTNGFLMLSGGEILYHRAEAARLRGEVL